MISHVSQKTNEYFVEIQSKNKSSDEFQATLNDIKKKEAKKSDVENENDLDLSTVRKNFELYAKNKFYVDGLKQAEEKHLQKLFDVIDGKDSNSFSL